MSSRGRRAVGVAAGAVLLLAGCGGVNRRFVVESNVPAAQVYIDDRPVGAAPAHAPFEYYGYYTIRLVHPDHETLTKRVHVVAPWYAYPPFDLLADVLLPFKVEDVRRYHFEMTPLRRPDPGELVQSADALRLRGVTLPRAADPAPDDPGPRTITPPGTVPAPPPAAQQLPPPAALPGPAPAGVVPRVGP